VSGTTVVCWAWWVLASSSARISYPTTGLERQVWEQDAAIPSPAHDTAGNRRQVELAV
jgi:hypothetical protein